MFVLLCTQVFHHELLTFCQIQHLELFIQHIQTDAYLSELLEELKSAFNIEVDLSMLWRTLLRMGITHKELIQKAAE